MNKDLTNHFIPVVEYHYMECKECGFDTVVLADYNGSEECPLCGAKSRRVGTPRLPKQMMIRRVAQDADDPEGTDQRVVTEQLKQPPATPVKDNDHE